MNQKHLLFLDYLLPRLSKCPDGEFIDSIAYEYEKESGISFDTDEIDHFESLYEYQYFTFPYSNLNRTAKITPETKEKIDHYGSLSKYLNNVNESSAIEQARLNNKEKLEMELAISNIESNKLNKRNESKNRVAMWINIVIGVLNALLLAWQILKD